MPITLQEETRDDALVLTLEGTLGIGDVDEFDRGLMKVSARHPKYTVVNMAGVTFISSLAMGALVSFKRGLARHDGQAVLADVSDLVLDVLKRANLNQVFTIYPSVDDAVANAPAA